jgi:hypothetical protein
MKNKSARMLPQTTDVITNGGVYLQRRRCGKTNCRCANGDGHVGYYFIRRIGGKFIKTYIRQSEVEQVAAVVNKASDDRRRLRQKIKDTRELVKSLNIRCRETDSIINSLKEGEN